MREYVEALSDALELVILALEEIGQELDSSRISLEHEVGASVMLLCSILSGARPSEAIARAAEYHNQWMLKGGPYHP